MFKSNWECLSEILEVTRSETWVSDTLNKAVSLKNIKSICDKEINLLKEDNKKLRDELIIATAVVDFTIDTLTSKKTALMFKLKLKRLMTKRGLSLIKNKSGYSIKILSRVT